MITQSELLSLVSYNESTGIFTWLRRPENNHSNKTFNKRYSGKSAGCIAVFSEGMYSGSYISIGIKKTKHLAHRLAWLYVYGVWPDQIDHINGNGLDNKISNLRSVSNSENAKNQKLRCTNKSGVSGVYWHNKARKWSVEIKVDGVKIYLGLSADKFEAICTRKSAERKYGFHENHGTKRPL